MFAIDGMDSIAEASTSVKPAIAKRFYRPELDALRFLAFLAVYLHHSIYVQLVPALAHRDLLTDIIQDFQNACALGVCLFFTLSAYLITTLIIKEQDSAGYLDLKAFYLRRVLRIWPLYFFILAVCVVIGLLFPSETLSAKHLAWFLLLIGNFYVVLFGSLPYTTTHLWSISIEEQFYLFWPLLAKIVNRRALVVGGTLIAAASILSIPYLASFQTLEQVWFNTLPHLLFFATGALFAIWMSKREFRKSSWKACCFLAGGLLIWFVAEATTKLLDFDFQKSAFVVPGYISAAVGCLLLLAGAHYAPAKMVPRVFVSLGKISYGLYIYHAIVLRALRNLPFFVPHVGLVFGAACIPNYRWTRCALLPLSRKAISQFEAAL